MQKIPIGNKAVFYIKKAWMVIQDWEIIIRKIIFYPFKIVFSFIWNRFLDVYEFVDDLFIYDLKRMFYRHIIENIRLGILKLEMRKEVSSERYIEFLLQHSNCENEAQLREALFGLVPIFTNIPEKIGCIVIFSFFYLWGFRYLYLYSIYGRYYKLRLFRFYIIMSFVVTWQFYLLEYMELLFIVDIHTFADDGKHYQAYTMVQPFMEYLLEYDYTQNIFIRMIMSLSVCQWVWIGEEYDQLIDNPLMYFGKRFKSVILFFFKVLAAIFIKPFLLIPTILIESLRSFFRLIFYLCRIGRQFYLFFYYTIYAILLYLSKPIPFCYWFIVYTSFQIIYFFLLIVQFLTGYPGDDFLTKFLKLTVIYRRQTTFFLFYTERWIDFYRRLNIFQRYMLRKQSEILLKREVLIRAMDCVWLNAPIDKKLRMLYRYYKRRLATWIIKKFFEAIFGVINYFHFLRFGLIHTRVFLYETFYEPVKNVAKGIFGIFRGWVFKENEKKETDKKENEKKENDKKENEKKETEKKENDKK